MKITKIDTIYQLTFIPRAFPVNAYLVEEDDSLTLVDAALPYSYKGILKASEKIGKPITRILLTHAHSDHIGALLKLKKALPEAKLYISKRENRILMGDLSLDEDEPKGEIKGGIPKKNFMSADILLEEGDTIGSLAAISAPGHTPGLMCFLDKRNNFLITGDAFQLRGGIAVSGTMVPLFPFPALATWDKCLSVKSAEKLLKLKPALLACGHGKMLRNPSEAMAQAIKSAKQNL